MPAGDDEPSSYPMPTTGTMQSDALNYAELNADAIAWSQEIVREQGWLFALGELKSLERGLISPNTALFIESQLLWLAGQTREATAMLNQTEVSDEASYDRLLAERQRRAAESGNPIDAARFALERLQLGYKSKSSVSDSDVLNLLSIASEQQIAAALRKAEPMSDWGWWLKLNLAYRQGRPAFMRWREAELQRPRGLQDLPASITTWINSDLPVRVAVLLPLSGRLKDAGERVLKGITEGLFEHYSNPLLRPELITIDTEVSETARAAYLIALERGADFVIGPLTKERVTELQTLDSLPVPVLALNRGTGKLSSELSARKSFLSLSLAPEDEAAQLASLIWQNGLRHPLLIAPETAWGRRMQAAFRDAWEGLGGDLRAVTLLSEDTSDNETIAQSLSTLQSESRIKEIEGAFDAPVDSQARRRADLDAVVLLAPNATLAREIRPLLRFHYAGKLPVFATSAIYEPAGGVANRDLNGVLFVLPAGALSDDSRRSQPLHALGLDAAAFIDHFNQAGQSRGILMYGDSGDLSVDLMANIRRRLIPVVMSRGKARRI